MKWLKLRNSRNLEIADLKNSSCNRASFAVISGALKFCTIFLFLYHGGKQSKNLKYRKYAERRARILFRHPLHFLNLTDNLKYSKFYTSSLII